MRHSTIALLGAAVGLGLAALPGAAHAAGRTITIDDDKVFPESIAADSAGNLYTGSLKGIVFRATPGSDKAVAWIRPDETNKLVWILGVLPHEPSNTLWVCSIPAGFGASGAPGETAAVALDLQTGAFKARHVLPSPGGTCNDLAVDRAGKVYIAETAGGRIVSIAPGASEAVVEVQDAALVGIDGLAFTEDDVLYVNNTRQNTMFRVNRDAQGAYESLTPLNVSTELKGPDALRPYKGNMLLQAETGSNRATLLTISGDNVDVKVLDDQTEGSAAITHIGDMAYTVPGRIQYLFSPDLRDKDPGPFVIRAIPIGTAP